MTTEAVMFDSTKTLDKAREEMSELLDEVEQKNVQNEDTIEYLDEINRKVEAVKNEQKIFYENITLRLDEMIDYVK